MHLKIPSHYHMLLLVAIYEGVLDLASEDVHLGAHGVRIAGKAGVNSCQISLAPGGWFVFYQPRRYQSVPRLLKRVQAKSLDATLENSKLLPTVFGKTGLLLEIEILYVRCCVMNLRRVHTV